MESRARILERIRRQRRAIIWRTVRSKTWTFFSVYSADSFPAARTSQAGKVLARPPLSKRPQNANASSETATLGWPLVRRGWPCPRRGEWVPSCRSSFCAARRLNPASQEVGPTSFLCAKAHVWLSVAMRDGPCCIRSVSHARLLDRVFAWARGDEATGTQCRIQGAVCMFCMSRKCGNCSSCATVSAEVSKVVWLSKAAWQTDCLFERTRVTLLTLLHDWW